MRRVRPTAINELAIAPLTKCGFVAGELDKCCLPCAVQTLECGVVGAK
jgi:hypothetical protein